MERNSMEFTEFPKMARLSRRVIISEKIDGTNAQIFIRRRCSDDVMLADIPITATHGDLLIFAGSRSRWITPDDDNFGFAKWVKINCEKLAALGEGQHFGEWWGSGIQRKYNMDEKRFSLFNTSRWSENRPSCCDVVPVLFDGIWTGQEADTALADLSARGSRAAPGFMKPEGIVLFHLAAGFGFKKTIEKDELPKSLA